MQPRKSLFEESRRNTMDWYLLLMLRGFVTSLSTLVIHKIPAHFSKQNIEPKICS